MKIPQHYQRRPANTTSLAPDSQPSKIGCRRGESKLERIFIASSSLDPIEHSKQSERLERLNFGKLGSPVNRTVRTLAQDSLHRIVTRDIRQDYWITPNIL